MTPSITIGVSACLLGEPVRYDGGNKLDRYITDTLGMDFILLPVCPEVGSGLPTPREEMRLEGDPAAPRLMTRWTRIDRSVQLLAFSANQIRVLENRAISGFIFKERSPSCGLTAALYGGTFEMVSVGLFANEVVSSFPLMPLEEAERLNDQRIRTDFIESVLLYHRMKYVK